MTATPQGTCISSTEPGRGSFLLLLRCLSAPFHLVRAFVGPVLVYDLVRIARSRRLLYLTCGYGGVVLLALLILHPHKAHLNPKEATRFGEMVFTGVLFVQFGVVLLISPVLAASGLAQERVRGTLDHLLATDLTAWDILSGKLASPLITMIRLVFLGLPVLALVQLLGGVDPHLAIAGFLATGVTILSMSSLALAMASGERHAGGAIFSTYLLAALYLVPSGGGFCGLTFSPSLDRWVGIGNFYVLLTRISSAPKGASASTMLGPLGLYILFHGAVMLVCMIFAVRHLRRRDGLAAPQSGETPNSTPRRESETVSHSPAASFAHPPISTATISNFPVLWREGHPRAPGGNMGFLSICTISLAVSFLLAVVMVGVGFWIGPDFSLLRQTVSVFASGPATLLAVFLWLGIAVRASTTITREKTQQTLDSLLLTPLSNTAILAGKGLGCFLAVQRGCWVVTGIWLAGLLTGAIAFAPFLLLILTLWGYAVVLAFLGLLFSLLCRTSTRAVIATLLTVLSLWSGPSILEWATTPPYTGRVTVSPSPPSRVPEVARPFLSPPVSLMELTHPQYQTERDSTSNPRRRAPSELTLRLLAVALHALTASALWGILHLVFRRTTGRMP